MIFYSFAEAWIEIFMYMIEPAEIKSPIFATYSRAAALSSLQPLFESGCYANKQPQCRIRITGKGEKTYRVFAGIFCLLVREWFSVADDDRGLDVNAGYRGDE